MTQNAMIFLLILRLMSIINAETLGSISYPDLAVAAEHEKSKLWSPETPPDLRPDYRPMERCDHATFTELNQKLTELVRSNHNIENFEWTTVSLTTLNSSKRSYILIGGSTRRVNPSSVPTSVSPRDGGTVYLCELEIKAPRENPLGFGLSATACAQLSKEQSLRGVHEYLGAASSTLTLNGNTSILAYCDPLWRATTQVPVGRCFLQLLQDGKLKDNLELSEFCQSGLQVGTPCMAGHSIALSLGSEQSANLLADVRLWVGQPLSIPFGRIQLISDPFGSSRVITIKRPDQPGPVKVGAHFGFAVADGYASAPSFPHIENEEISTIAQLVGIQIANAGGQSRESFGSVDWLGSIELDQIFSGFGTSVLKIPLNGLIQTAIVVGAPYANAFHSNETNSAQKQTNRGRIYMFCHTDGHFRKPMQAEQFQLYNDSLDGPAEATFFGFALSRLGDLDGDGTEDIAVGAPDLDGRTGHGLVYLIRVLPSCQFDRSPLHILKGPKGASDFGARLPARAEDLDYNSWPDLAIPISTRENGAPGVQLYATRPRIEAECRFTFPPWLAIRKILAGDTIPIQLTVFLRSPGRDLSVYDPIEQILSNEEAGKLVHQIIADWNATNTAEQRFQLFGDIVSQFDRQRSKLLIEFDLVAEQDVQDMIDIETENKGLYIAYRFLQPCFGQDHVVDENGTCAESGWLKRPLITWSKCLTHVPLPRYICYPRPACEGDVSLSVTDLNSKVVLSRSNESSISDTAETINATESMTSSNASSEIETGSSRKNPILLTTVDLVFGDQASSRPELLIELHNNGPTFAAGLWLEFQFHGNLRFSRLESYDDHAVLPVTVSENETWANYYVGTMPAPTISDYSESEEEVPTVKRWKLSTYYPNYTLPEATNYTRGAGVTIQAISGTPDPETLGNSVRFDYRVVNAPRVRISYGPKSISSRMDNRTRPAPGILGHLRRVDVSEVGPRVEHVIQVEYEGPTAKLTNVTFRINVPFQLAPGDQLRGSENYLIYLFPEVRASLEGSSALQWVDMWPKVTAYSSQIQSASSLGSCFIVDAENTVNPLRMVGMDVTQVYSRTRRHAIRKEVEKVEYASNTTQLTPEQLEIMSAGFEASNGAPPTPSLFRRIPKEILQCDRVGYRLEKPICTQIVCHLEELQKNRPVLFSLTGWLWAKTLFEKHISDVDVVTSLAVDQGHVPEGVVPAPEPVGNFHLAQTFFFPQIRPKLLHQIPIWPIIVGVVLGIIFLALIVILLYVLGFFKRKKPGLRQASYSKGGADELERRAQETSTKRKGTVSFEDDDAEEDNSKLDKYERGSKRKLRGKHRGEMKILHPADLAASKTTEDEQHERLLTDPPEVRADEAKDNTGVTDTPGT